VLAVNAPLRRPPRPALTAARGPQAERIRFIGEGERAVGAPRGARPVTMRPPPPSPPASACDGARGSPSACGQSIRATPPAMRPHTSLRHPEPGRAMGVCLVRDGRSAPRDVALPVRVSMRGDSAPGSFGSGGREPSSSGVFPGGHGMHEGESGAAGAFQGCGGRMSSRARARRPVLSGRNRRALGGRDVTSGATEPGDLTSCDPAGVAMFQSGRDRPEGARESRLSDEQRASEPI